MTAHADRIRQAEEASGVYDDTSWEVGDLVQDPANEKLPDKTVLIDRDGDPWKLSAGDWYIPAVTDPGIPSTLHGPYVVAWIPKEADDE